MRKVVDKSILGKVWSIPTYQNEENFVGTENLINRILANRGVVGDDNVRKFLNPLIREYMPDPSVMQDMDKASKIIADAILRGDKIAIYGDYDVDGITSTAIFIKYLTALGVDVIWHLPTREGEGYGLNTAAIDDIVSQGAKLMITVDCGISGVAEVAHAKSRGLSVVITDHHSPDSVLPDADAVINPKRSDDSSGLEYMAGVGVAFLTLVGLNRELKTRDLSPQMRQAIEQINLMNYLDFVALGTICDTMPLVGLNRAFVARGLQIMDLRQNLGLRVLMNVSGINKSTVYAAGFALGPRLNAAGRLDSAAPALDLLLTDNPLVAQALAEKLHKMNQDRIDIQNAIMLRADEMAQNAVSAGRASLFICGDNWHGGVMGIIAGRLKDKYNLPACVATRSDGIINGSGRSISGVDLGHIIHQALSVGIISEGGGHAAAAGFSLPIDKEQEFAEFLESHVQEQLNGNLPVAEIIADAEIDSGGATISLVKQLAALEPFGQSNPEPTLILHGASLRYASTMGGGAHLRGCVNTSSGTQLQFVGFNLTNTPLGNFLLDDANTGTKITMLGKLKENHNGRGGAQFYLEDIYIG